MNRKAKNVLAYLIDQFNRETQVSGAWREGIWQGLARAINLVHTQNGKNTDRMLDTLLACDGDIRNFGAK